MINSSKQKLLYIHGLSSSGNSNTVRTLRRLLPEMEIIAPDIPVEPRQVLSLLEQLCEKENPDIVIGTSMGGMFAQQLHGYRKILINPAFHVSEFMRSITGVQPFLNPRIDGAVEYEITEDLCDAYMEIEKTQFCGVTDFDKENTFGFFGKNDTLVCCEKEFRQYYKHYYLYQGEHRLSVEDIRDTIIPFIKQIL